MTVLQMLLSIKFHLKMFYNRNLKIYVCHSVIAALFTRAMARKQPECSLVEGWMRERRGACIQGYYSAVKKNKIMPLAAHGWAQRASY